MADPSQPSDRPLVISGDEVLVDDLLRVAADVDVVLTVVADAGAAQAWWASAPIVLVGDDQSEALARACLPPRGAVVVISRGDDMEVFHRAARVGASHVDFLPDGEEWVAELLRDSATARPGPLVVGVVGGRGGAGASTLAAALSFAGLRRGMLTLLVDADPLGGGMDLLLGPQQARGLRWVDLVFDETPLYPQELFELSGGQRCAPAPELDDLTVLSWEPGDLADVPAKIMDSVLGAARWAADLVVVDLPRRPDEAAEVVLGRAHRTFLVIPAEVRSIASAARVASAVGPISQDLQVVVRGPAPTGLTPEVVADCVGRPLAGACPAEPGLATALDRGRAPGRGPGPLSELADQLLDDLVRARSVHSP